MLPSEIRECVHACDVLLPRIDWTRWVSHATSASDSQTCGDSYLTRFTGLVSGSIRRAKESLVRPSRIFSRLHHLFPLWLVKHFWLLLYTDHSHVECLCQQIRQQIWCSFNTCHWFNAWIWVGGMEITLSPPHSYSLCCCSKRKPSGWTRWTVRLIFLSSIFDWPWAQLLSNFTIWINDTRLVKQCIRNEEVSGSRFRGSPSGVIFPWI